MIRMIIYDFDGTIADSLRVMLEAYNRQAVKRGFKLVTENNAPSLRAQAPREALRELGIKLYQVPGLIYRVLKDVRPEVVNLAPHTGMKEWLYRARELGYRQAILTSNLEDSVRGFLLNNDLNLFDHLYCGSGAFGKTRSLKKLLKDTQLTPREVVYVGDEIRDIEATRRVGISIICVGWGYNTREILESHHPHAVINRPEELLPAVERLR